MFIYILDFFITITNIMVSQDLEEPNLRKKNELEFFLAHSELFWRALQMIGGQARPEFLTVTSHPHYMEL